MNLPVIIAAAICSGSVLIAIIGWGRSDAVRAATIQQHEMRLDNLETDRRIESQAVIVLQQDIKHISKTVDEIKAEVKSSP